MYYRDAGQPPVARTKATGKLGHRA